MLVLNLGHAPLIVSTQPLPTPYIKGLESHCLFCFNFYLHEIIVQQHQEEVFHSPSRLLSICGRNLSILWKATLNITRNQNFFLSFFQIFLGRKMKRPVNHAFTTFIFKTVRYIFTTAFNITHLLLVSEPGIWRYFHKAFG